MPKRTGHSRPVVDRQESGNAKTKKLKRQKEQDAKQAGAMDKFMRGQQLEVKTNNDSVAALSRNETNCVEDSPSFNPMSMCSVDLEPQNESETTENVEKEASNPTMESDSDDQRDLQLSNAECTPSTNSCNEPKVSKVTDDKFANEIDSLYGLHSTAETNPSADPVVTQIDFSDPVLWPNPLSSVQLRMEIIQRGPVQKKLKFYPVVNGRSFHNEHYRRTLRTNETQDRDWLLYSESSNSLFCFPCCIFGSNLKSSAWSNFGPSGIGFTTFVYQSKALQEHENSRNHRSAVVAWRDFLRKSGTLECVDATLRAEYEREASHWRQVLRSIIHAILFLAKNNLAFRGSSDKYGEQNCGNFLSLIELLSHYHAPLARHVATLEKGKVTYMSPQIQNEFISLAAGTVRKAILSKIRDRKFYSILFDATPDCSHKEQISEIIRTVNVSKQGCSIHENFVDFLHLDLKKGIQISETILLKLKTDGIEISNCRGQGYDNGANMSGIYNGVQAHIKRANPLAEFIPCAAHTLNLVGQNAALKVLPGKLILGQIQTLYSFFASSTYRWNVLKPHVSSVLKAQSQTRWASKSNAVNALCNGFEGELVSLEELINSPATNATTLVEATANLNQVSNFRFVLGLCVWNSILNRINGISLALQDSNNDIEKGWKLLQGLLNWLTTFSENGFESCLQKAIEKASDLGINEETGFEYRITRNKLPQRFQSGACVVVKPKSNMEKFKEDFFDAVMKLLIEDIRSRFHSLKETSEEFSFLWGEHLSTFSTVELQKWI